MVIHYIAAATLRQILEDLYFVAGVVIAIAAIKGLRQLKIGLEQIRITREIAKSNSQIAATNARREAIKLAAERCQYFAEHTVPEFTKMGTTYTRLKLTFLSSNPQWMIVNGEIVNHNFDLNVQDAQLPQFIVELVNAMNAIEAFAIPFVAAVADDDIGYQETALGFCQEVKLIMPAIFYVRRKGMARFESTVQLYDRWNKRLVASAMAPLLKPMEAIIREANREELSQWVLRNSSPVADWSRRTMATTAPKPCKRFKRMPLNEKFLEHLPKL